MKGPNKLLDAHIVAAGEADAATLAKYGQPRWDYYTPQDAFWRGVYDPAFDRALEGQK